MRTGPASLCPRTAVDGTIVADVKPWELPSCPLFPIRHLNSCSPPGVRGASRPWISRGAGQGKGGRAAAAEGETRADLRKTALILGNYAEDHDLGHVLCNDSGVITERGPDSVRRADVAFYSYAKLPKGPLPQSYPAVPPDLIFEVMSPSDRWPKVYAKVAEYLDAGVSIVGVLDPERQQLLLFNGDAPVRILNETDELTLPTLLGDFRVVVGKFFA